MDISIDDKKIEIRKALETPFVEILIEELKKAGWILSADDINMIKKLINKIMSEEMQTFDISNNSNNSFASSLNDYFSRIILALRKKEYFETINNICKGMASKDFINKATASLKVVQSAVYSTLQTGSETNTIQKRINERNGDDRLDYLGTNEVGKAGDKPMSFSNGEYDIISVYILGEWERDGILAVLDKDSVFVDFNTLDKEAFLRELEKASLRYIKSHVLDDAIKPEVEETIKKLIYGDQNFKIRDLPDAVFDDAVACIEAAFQHHNFPEGMINTDEVLSCDATLKNGLNKRKHDITLELKKTDPDYPQ